jgi:integrase/recombinase XerD
MDIRVAWEDPRLQRWLATITRKGTRQQYRTAWQSYVTFTGLHATELIQEALEDQQRSTLKKQDIVKKRLLDFYHWLITEAPVYKRGTGNIVIGKGLKSKTASARVSAIRSFYATYDITVRLKGRSKLPRPKVENTRLIVDNEKVRILLQYTTSLRDRAMILTLFQSGMDVSTLISLNYRHIKNGLDTDEHPLQLNLFRLKTGIEYFSFLGRDAINAIQAYLRDMRTKGITFHENTPLFIKAIYTTTRPLRLSTKAVQKILREVAHRSPFVNPDNNGKDFNPLSPHALRESFGSIMSMKGVPDTIVDFWLGHAIGEMANAYKRVQPEELRRVYAEREIFISVSAPTTDIENRVKQRVEQAEQKITRGFQESRDELQSIVNRLTSKNLAMDDVLQRLSTRNQQLEANFRSLNERTQGQMESLVEQSAEFNQQILTLTQEKQTLELQIGALKNTNCTLTEQVNNLKADIASVRSNWEYGDKIIEKLRWLYLLFLQQQYPRLKTMNIHEFEQWHNRMRDSDSFYREIVDRDLIRKFAEWLPNNKGS